MLSKLAKVLQKMEPSSEKTNKYIICCMCGDTPAFSRDAYKLLFPNTPMPQVELQPTLYNFLPSLKRDGNFYNYVKDHLINEKAKYSYYFEVAENGDIVDQWNLLTGKRAM